MSSLDQIKQKIPDQFKVTQIRGKLFVDDKYIIEISVLGRNSIIICDTIFCNRKYTTYLVSIKDREVPGVIIKNLMTYLHQG